eukprot:s130_g17.t4
MRLESVGVVWATDFGPRCDSNLADLGDSVAVLSKFTYGAADSVLNAHYKTAHCLTWPCFLGMPDADEGDKKAAADEDSDEEWGNWSAGGKKEGTEGSTSKALQIPQGSSVL